jgi:hypothetical protein
MSQTHNLTATCHIGNVSCSQHCRPEGSAAVGVVIKSFYTVFGSSFSSKHLRQSKGSSVDPVGKVVAGLNFSYVSTLFNQQVCSPQYAIAYLATTSAYNRPIIPARLIIIVFIICFVSVTVIN